MLYVAYSLVSLLGKSAILKSFLYSFLFKCTHGFDVKFAKTYLRMSDRLFERRAAMFQVPQLPNK